MNLVENWTKMIRSLAVVLPTLAVFALALLDAFMQTQLVPLEYMPIVVAISAFLGRIIKQPKLGG